MSTGKTASSRQFVLLSTEFLSSWIFLSALGLLSLLIESLELLLHEVVVELNLADEAPMFTAPVQRLEALEDAVDYKRVVLVAHRHQVSVALVVHSQ